MIVNGLKVPHPDDPLTLEEMLTYLRYHMDYAHVATLGTRDERELIKFLSLELCGEAGELANLIKKAWRGGWRMDSGESQLELADVMIVSLMLCVVFGMPPMDMINRKMVVVYDRWRHLLGPAHRKKGGP
jgi:NTP pyrophosphatase (non-canonical NTP hydrolase)